MKVYLDAGHGGHDSGAVGFNKAEKHFALDICMRVNALLRANGVNTMTTRTDDHFVSLTQRASMCNNWGADLFVSFHCNSGGGRGAEVWHSISGGQGKIVAERIDNNLRSVNVSRGLKTKRGKHGDYIYVIRATHCPAVLIEFGFMDNATDVELLNNSTIRQRYAEAVCKAILGVNIVKSTNTPINTNPSLDGRLGTITAKSGLRVRSQPNTSCTILGTLPYGHKVKLFKKVNDYWYEIYYGQHGGYVYAPYISI